MIDIYSLTGEILLSVPVLASSVSHEELMTSDYVHLEWEAEGFSCIPAGSYIVHEGERYSLFEPYYPTRKNDVVCKYAPQFQSRVMRWNKVFVPIYTYEDDGTTVKSRELDWTFVGTPYDAMSMVVRAIRHEVGEEWKFELGDNLPETIELNAQSASVWSILSEIAELCKTEWWTKKSANYLYLSKCAQGVPVELEVGKNVKVPSISKGTDSEYFTRFYAFGSTRNVTQSDGVVQGSIVKKRLTLDPKKYPMGYKDIKGHFEDGVFVSDLLPEEVFPTSLYFDDVYPSSSLQISNVRKRMRYHLDDDGKKIRVGGTEENPIYDQYAIWYFQMEGFDFSDDLIIENMMLSVVFKSGRLRGREFELTYHPESMKVADAADVDEEFSVVAGEYEIIMDDSVEGMIIPDDDYLIPEEFNAVTLFNIEMPQEYTDSAMIDLEEKLDEEIAERLKDNKVYEFNSNPVAFYNDETDVTLGQYVRFINSGELLESRVLMVEKHLDYPFEQKIRVGNELIKGSRQQLREEVKNISEDVTRLREIESVSSVARRDNARDLMITMGRYYAMRDTLGLLQDAVDGFEPGINPITIHTMSMLVGDESFQFKFVKSREDLTPIDCPLVYDASAKQLVAEACGLVHLTLDVPKVISNEYSSDIYKSWDMESWPSEIVEDATTPYYVYAKVEREGGFGTYELSTTPKKMRGTVGYYYLLVGILNSEYAGTREFITLYGFTEVLPGQISTDVIRSADGKTYFDLAKGVISGEITFQSGSSGLENLSEWSEKQTQIDTAQSTANTAKSAAATAQSTADEAKEMANTANAATKTLDTKISNIETGVNESVAEINARLDGVVENYFEEGAPSTNMELVQGWKDASETDDYELINHVGDTYTNIQEYENDDTTPDAGKSWRWCWCEDTSVTDKIEVTDKEGNVRYLHWHPIADSDAVKALLEASKAKTAADGKSKTFVSEPIPPYKEGDLWVQGTSGDIMRCKASRSSGSYTASDWEIASKYTDDTRANEAYSLAEESKKKLDEITADGVINKSEIQFFITEDANVTTSTNLLKSEAKKYGIDTSGLETLSAMYLADIGTILSSETFPIVIADIVPDLTWHRNGFYGSRTNIQDAIDTANKGQIEAAQEAADDANKLIEAVDSDGVLTGIEKQSLRESIKKITSITDPDGLVGASEDGGVIALGTGSFHEYFNKLISIGMEDQAIELHTYLSAILTFLDDDGVWDDGNSNVDASFRTVLQDMIAGYSSVEAASVKSIISDWEFLKNAFASGTTNVVGGVVMTNMVAVKDAEDNEIEAFLNGSDFASDTEHKKLILAGGIPTTTSGGSTDLIERSKEAATRIYEDGTIDTKKLLAKAGKIGDFEISDIDGGVFLKADGDRDDGKESITMSLSGWGLQMHAKRAASTSEYPAYTAQSTVYPSQGYAGIMRNEFTDTSNEDDYFPNPCKALIVSAKGAKISDNTNSGGNFAVYNEYGMIGGLRPRVLAISVSSFTLSAIDHTVLVTTACTITLPDEPQNGQEYEILCPNSGDVFIQSSTQQIYLMLDGVSRNGFNVKDLQGTRQVVKLVYFEADGKWFAWYNTY